MKRFKSICAGGKIIGDGLIPAIITPLVGKTKSDVLEEVETIVLKKPDLLEWRIDFFESIGNVPLVIETALAIRQKAGGIPVLLTRRNATEGGQALSITETEVVAMYLEACRAKCVEMVDYELSNDISNLEKIRAVSKENGISMIMSFHDFKKTPDANTLDSKFAAAAKYGADVGKVAVMPQSDQDVLELLAATGRAREAFDMPLISMSMGGLGALSRIVGWVYGSAATFAVGKSSSAPGQIAIDDLRHVVGILRNSVPDA